jgi:hypothetical protein
MICRNAGPIPKAPLNSYATNADAGPVCRGGYPDVASGSRSLRYGWPELWRGGGAGLCDAVEIEERSFVAALLWMTAKGGVAWRFIFVAALRAGVWELGCGGRKRWQSHRTPKVLVGTIARGRGVLRLRSSGRPRLALPNPYGWAKLCRAGGADLCEAVEIEERSLVGAQNRRASVGMTT